MIVITAVVLTIISSRWTFRFIDYTQNTTRFEVWAQQGRLGILVGDASMYREVWGERESRIGVRWRPQRERMLTTNGANVLRVNGVIVPVWCFGTFGLVVVTGVWWFRMRRPEIGTCIHCRYSLEGLTDNTCPECGVTITHA